MQTVEIEPAVRRGIRGGTIWTQDAGRWLAEVVEYSLGMPSPCIRVNYAH